MAADIFAVLAGGMAAVAVGTAISARRRRIQMRRDHAAAIPHLGQHVDRDPQVLMITGSGHLQTDTTGIESPNVIVSIERSKTAQKQLRIANG